MTVTSCQMSGCKEPAPTMIFSPFQDHPHPPIRNILEKAFNNNLGCGRTKLKMSLPLTHHVDLMWYKLGTHC